MSDVELQSLRALYPIIERVRPALDASVEAAALEIPALAKLIEQMDPAARDTQVSTIRALERAALLDGEWAPYAAHLRDLGATYARMGVDVEHWHALLRPYRDVVEAEVLPASSELERTVLRGMNLFLNKSMAAIAESYVAEKERALRRTTARLGLYEQMFRDSPLAKVIYDWESPPDPASFRVAAANMQAVALDDAGVFPLAGDGVEEGGLLRRLASATETGEPHRWTIRESERGTGRVFDCHCFGMGHRNAGLLVQDVTQLRRAEDTLARHVRELERSNRELDGFAYVASHDLKAPLRDIDSLAMWIEEDALELLPDGSRRHLGTIRERIRRMERLLDDLLQYSRAGRIFHEAEPFELRKIIDDVLSVAPPPAAFQVVVTGDAPPLRAPRVPLETVLRNLVTNAVKHHHTGAGRIDIGISPGAEHVELTVSDDGPGIAPEFHERVFRMFQTLKPRDAVEGSGMGLAIVKKIVEAHDGEMILESAPGKGTTFRFTWPRDWRRS